MWWTVTISSGGEWIRVDKKTAKPRTRKAKLPPALQWLRTATIASCLFGFGTLFIWDWFWPGIFCIYSFFVLLALDAWFAPELSHQLSWKIGVWALIAIGAAAFTWLVVFVDAPLPVAAFMVNAEYDKGVALAGIQWRPEFTEVDLEIPNPTDNSYQDLNMTIRPTTPVAAIAQQTSFPDVTFEDKHELLIHLLDINIGTGARKALPLDLLATDSGYRVRCSRVAPKSTIKLVIALADIRWCPKPRSQQLPIFEQMKDSEYILRIKDDDFGTYWMGHKDGDVYAPRPTSTDFVTVDATYVAAHRKRSFSQKLNVGGDLSIRR